jgi:hypothetical protein
VIRLTAALCCTAALAAPAPASATTEAQNAYAAGVAAYVHGYPPLISAASKAHFLLNSLVGVAATTTPQNRLVVLPNVDTAYTVARLDLRRGPVIVHVPAMRGRYYVFELLDAYTNVFGYIGTRVTGSAAGSYAIAGPGTRAHVAGVTTIHSPTPDALLLGRTLVKPTDSSAALHQILGSYEMTPPSGAPAPSAVIDASPKFPPATVPRGIAFLDAFDALLAQDPPSAAERRALAPLRRFGIGPGLRASATNLPAVVRRALLRGVAAGPGRVDAAVAQLRRSSIHSHAGWLVPGRGTGDAGSDWMLRAIVARIGLWANTPDEAIYPIAASDSAGRPLSGRHRYTLRFTGRPQAKAFWSLTMYDSALHLYENPLHRYALGDRSQGLRPARDGSLTLHLQHTAPKRGRAAWLPAPAGRFVVALRLYIPPPAVLRGGWSPPGIRCVDCGRRR